MEGGGAWASGISHVKGQEIEERVNGKQRCYSYYSRGWVMGVGRTVIRGRWTCG